MFKTLLGYKYDKQIKNLCWLSMFVRWKSTYFNK